MKATGIFVTIVGDNSGSMVKDLTALAWRSMNSKLFGGQQYRFFFADTSEPVVVDTMKELTELVEQGSVKPLIDDQTFALTTKGIMSLVQASKSHRATGKLVLKVI